MKRTHGLLVAGVLALAGCSLSPPPEMAPPPPVVTVAVPAERDVTEYADFTGRTAAVGEVKVRARVWGHLQKVNFTEGAEVKKGDLLFVIDPQPYQAALERAEADVAQSEVRFKRLERDHTRARNLVGSGAVSREEFDKIAGDLSEAQAAHRSSLAARSVAKLNLGYTEVRAPIDGQISRAMVTAGNLVESGELGGTLLTTLVSVDPVYAYFDVDDLTFVQIRPYVRSKAGAGVLHPVQLSLPSETGFPHQG